MSHPQGETGLTRRDDGIALILIAEPPKKVIKLAIHLGNPGLTVTDAVLEAVSEWQNRPLDACYAIVFFDAIRVKIRDEGFVRNKAVYIALAILPDGTKEILGLWIEQTEGAKFWLRVMNELKYRGVQDILLAVVDGLNTNFVVTAQVGLGLSSVAETSDQGFGIFHERGNDVPALFFGGRDEAAGWSRSRSPLVRIGSRRRFSA